MSESSPLYTRTFWTACAIHFTGGMSLGMFLLFPLFIRARGGDELTIGAVLGLGLAASVLARPAIGALLDRRGRRWVLCWAGGLNACSFLPFLLVGAVGPALYLLGAAHLVFGGALFSAYFTYAADLVPAARRAEGLAIFGVAGMAPNGIGPPLGEWLIAHAGWPGFLVTATGFALVSFALSTRIPRLPAAAPAVHEPGTGSLLATLRHGGLARVGAVTLVFGAGINAAFYFVAPFTRTLGLARAGSFFAAYATTTIVLRVTGRRLLDRLGPHRVSIPAFGVFAAGLGALCLLPAPGILVAAGIACGAGHGSLFPVLGALAVARTPRRLHGTVMSVYTGAMDLGAVVGTPLCGAIAEIAGYRAMFATTAAGALAGLVLMARDPGRES